MTSSTANRWWALAVLGATQFMVALDLAVVNVALPSIQSDLGLSPGSLKWVVTAHALVLGGFLLLGGRAADVLGRRRTLVAGLVVFALGSILAGLAWNGAALIGARGLQGLGTAAVVPAALALLTTTFHEGRDRTVALGVWGAAGALGGASGVLLGGVLTSVAGWQWVFFLDLPVAGVAIASAPLLLRESRAGGDRRLDTVGAVLVAGGLSATVLAVSRASESGLGSPQTLAAAVAAAGLLAAFVATELRVADPLMPVAILRVRAFTAVNVVGLAVTASVSSMFLLLTLYMQRVLGFSPLQTGLAYLAIALTSTAGSTAGSRLVSRVGAKPVLVTGLGLLALGLASFTRAPVEGAYVRDLLPGFVVVATGMSLSFVAVNVAALSGIEARDAGIASGLLGTSQQVGGALGVALLSSIAVAHSDAGLRAGDTAAVALAGGIRAAFSAGSLIALAGAVAALLLLRRESEDATVGCDDAPLVAVA